VVNLDPALGEEFFDVAGGQVVAQVPATATTMTSGGSGSRRRRTVLREQGEGGGFSSQQSRCQDAVAADATVPSRFFGDCGLSLW
jgi:hypothetical protein